MKTWTDLLEDIEPSRVAEVAIGAFIALAAFGLVKSVTNVTLD